MEKILEKLEKLKNNGSGSKGSKQQNLQRNLSSAGE